MIKCFIASVLLLSATASLRAAEAVRTDLYGDPLPPGAVARMGTVRWRQGHNTPRFTPDGKHILAGSVGISVLDAQTGRELRFLPRAMEPLIVSNDSKFLAAQNFQGPLCVWDLAAGKRVCQLPPVYIPIAFSADGRTLLTSGVTGGAQVPRSGFYFWEVPSGKQSRYVPVEVAPERPFAASPDGCSVFAKGGKRTIRHIDLGTGREIRKWEAPHTEQLGELAISADGKLLASGGKAPISGAKENTLYLWDTATGRELRRFTGRARYALCESLAVSQSGEWVANAGEGTLYLWNTTTGEERKDFREDPQYIWGVAFSPDGKTLVTQSLVTQLWDMATGKPLNPDSNPNSPARQVSFLRGKPILAAVNTDGTVWLWDLNTARNLRRFSARTAKPHNGDYFQALAASPDAELLATVGWGEKVVHLWNILTSKEIGLLAEQDSPIVRLAFSPAGGFLVTLTRDSKLRLYNLSTNKEVRRFGGVSWHSANRGLGLLAFSHDGRILAAVRSPSDPQQKALFLWETDTGKELPGPLVPYPGQIVFSPVDPLLILSGGRFLLWDLQRAKQVDLIRDRSGPIRAFSPDGRMFAVVERRDFGAGGDAEQRGDRIVLWELRTRQRRRAIQTDSASVCDLAFSPDGRHLASANENTTVLVYDTLHASWAGVGTAALSPNKLESLWTDLSSDAIRAYDAICTLSHFPTQTVSWIKAHLHPDTTTNATRIAQRIAELDDRDYRVREEASLELAKLGRSALPYLQRAVDSAPEGERRRRLERLLARPEIQGGATPGELRAARAVEALEHIGTDQAQELLADLSRGAPESALTQEARAALRRLRPNSLRRESIYRHE